MYDEGYAAKQNLMDERVLRRLLGKYKELRKIYKTKVGVIQFPS